MHHIQVDNFLMLSVVAAGVTECLEQVSNTSNAVGCITQTLWWQISHQWTDDGKDSIIELYAAINCRLQTRVSTFPVAAVYVN